MDVVERVIKFSQVPALSLGVRPTVDRRLSAFDVCRCFVVSYSLFLLFLLCFVMFSAFKSHMLFVVLFLKRCVLCFHTHTLVVVLFLER